MSTYIPDVISGIDYGKLKFILASLEVSTTPTIYNATLAFANQDYGVALPAGTKKFMVKERNGNPFRLAFQIGVGPVAPAIPYLNVLSNQVYWEDHVYLTGVTIFVAAPIAGRVIEIICWT